MKFAFDAHMHILPLKYVCWSSYFDFIQQNMQQEAIAIATAPEYLARDVMANPGAALNLLSVLENDVCGTFCVLEDDLAGLYKKKAEQRLAAKVKTHRMFENTTKQYARLVTKFKREGGRLPQPAPVTEKNITIAGAKYDRLVITPLIMDFNAPAELTDAYYSTAPKHAVLSQAAGILEGMRKFRHRRPDSLMIVRPFLGINPIYWNVKDINTLLNTYFGAESGWSPYADDAVRTWDELASIKHFGENSVLSGKSPVKNAFAGIKLYPPLGFDPWPDDAAEHEKVEALYSFCEKNKIPVVTHCDDQGFRTMPLEESLHCTSPERWALVLEHHPDLYLDIAHFGRQYYIGLRLRSTKPWRDIIVDLILKYPHVYTDLSFDGVDPAIWKQTAELIAGLPQQDAETLSHRIMFGTDWPLCLSKIESALQYWEYFAGSPMKVSTKQLLISSNPQDFFFRKRAGC